MELHSICVLGENGWEVSLEQLDKLNSNSVLYLNSPNAISGFHIPATVLKQIFAIVKEKKCICIFDQIIRDLTWEEEFAHPLELAAQADILDQIFFLYGPSKDKSIPGARIGYMYCPKNFASQISTMLNLRNWAPPLVLSELTQLDSILNCLQAGFRDYNDFSSEREVDINSLYENYRKEIRTNIKIIKKNMELICQELASFITLSNPPSSGYSLFLQLSNVNHIDQAEFTKKLELQYGLRTTLGPMFGLTTNEWEGGYGLWIRLNATLSESALKQGISILKTVLSLGTR
jgi:aspartate/methionine/tyrosine aminotransferase